MNKNIFYFFLLTLIFFSVDLTAGGTYEQRAANQQRKAAKTKAPSKRLYHDAKVRKYQALALQYPNTLSRPSTHDVQSSYASLAHQQPHHVSPEAFNPWAQPHQPPYNPANPWARSPDFQNYLDQVEAESQARSIRRKHWAMGIGGSLGLGAGIAGLGLAINQATQSNSNDPSLTDAQAAALQGNVTALQATVGDNTTGLAATRKALDTTDKNLQLLRESDIAEFRALSGKIGDNTASIEKKANADDVYTKTVADDKFASLSDVATLQYDINNDSTGLMSRALATDVYTKTDADGRFAPKPTITTPTTTPPRGGRQ